jgi:hypothetical protein
MAENTPYRGQLKVRFWSPSYQPEQELDPLAIGLGEFEVNERGGDPASWRPARPGQTLADVGEWMRENDLTVMRRERVSQRRTRTWEGRYVLTIGPEVTK